MGALFSGPLFAGALFAAPLFHGATVVPPPGHRYDTRLPKPQRTIIREGVVARLAPLLKSNGGYLHAIAELPKVARSFGEDSDDRAMLFDALNGRCPAVAVALGGRTSESSGTLATEGRARIVVEVYVASQHARGLVAGRLAADIVATGDATADPVLVPNLTADPGVELVLEHVEQLLLGHSLEDDAGDALSTIAELRARDEDEVATFADFTVWVQRYEVAVERVINPARALTQLLTSIESHNTESRLAELTPGTHDLAPLTTVSTISPPEEP